MRLMTVFLDVDFNDVDEDGTLYAAALSGEDISELRPGDEIFVIDGERNFCLAQIISIRADRHGNGVIVRPDWDTWEDGPR